jgi:glycosyltransferase involved in cell wall biosynthesis
MRKRKVLFVTEASFHPTGYSVYTKEVLSRLSRHPEIEVAELGCYADANTPDIKNVPWKFYPNVPLPDNENLMNIYNSSMSNKFGEFSLNSVLLDFQPDFVMDIRDWWMLEFTERSPFREFFNWAIMPTVDAEPQNTSWIDTYSTADGVFAYSEFGRDVMLSQSNKLNFVDVASPCASNTFFPFPDKGKIRNEMGLREDVFIFGTVMRNQRRKLYPDLFKAFRSFLDKNPDLTNHYLYCHTGYPDVGWDIPSLIRDNGLSNKVLFTYKCRNCGEIKASFFNDVVTFCGKCHMTASTLVGLGNRMEDKDLNRVYNLFDVYIQWANSEGWGMPQLEAAYAGLPIVSVHYSAMESLINNIHGIGIKPIGYYKELETGCLRAIPDNEKLTEVLTNLARDKSKLSYTANKCYTNSKKIYNWDYTANKWLKYFLETPLKDESQTWKSPLRIFNPPNSYPKELETMSTVDQVNWLVINVLGKPELLNKSQWKKLVKDLTYRVCISNNIPGYYFNEFTHPDMERRMEEFNLQKAFEICRTIRQIYNDWEKHRLERVLQK